MPRLRAETAALIQPAVMPEVRSPVWWLRYIPALVGLVLLTHLLYVMGSVALIPVLASFALAYVLNPLVDRIQENGMRREWAALLALSIVFSALTLFLMFVIPDLWQQAMTASDKLLRNFTPASAAQHRANLREFSPLLDRMLGLRLQQFLRSPEELTMWARTAATGSFSGVLTTFAASADLLLIPFFVYYILVEFQAWRVSMEDLIPPRFRATCQRLFDEMGRILQSYVLGQLLIALMMGVLYAIGFAALQVPAWAGIAALAGLLNVVPYVGTILGLVLAGGFTFATHPDLWRVGGIVAVFTAVQCVEGYYLTPRILGGRLSLHPMAVFLGLLIGGKLFGLLGILLAVPSIAVAFVLLKLTRELYKDSFFYHGGDLRTHEVPSEMLEERLARAADTVLTEQVEKQDGSELLTPIAAQDDPVARQA